MNKISKPYASSTVNLVLTFTLLKTFALIYLHLIHLLALLCQRVFVLVIHPARRRRSSFFFFPCGARVLVLDEEPLSLLEPKF